MTALFTITECKVKTYLEWRIVGALAPVRAPAATAPSDLQGPVEARGAEVVGTRIHRDGVRRAPASG